jgi:hypothetical protein
MNYNSSGSSAYNISDRIILQIGGLPRSGTTALTDIVNECPEVAVMSEYRLADLIEHLCPIFDYQNFSQNADRSVINSEFSTKDISSFVDQTVSTQLNSLDKWYSNFAAPDLNHTLRYPTVERLPDIVTSVVQASLDKPDARVIGSKTPGHMLFDVNGAIRRMNGDVRYVAMLRSPLSQINSSINRRNGKRAGKDTWHLDTVDEAIDHYLEVIFGLIVLQSKVENSLLFIKYEDMINDPSNVFDKLFSHIDSMWRPDRQLTYVDRGTLDVLTSEERKQVLQRLGNVIENWEDALLSGKSEIDFKIFNHVLPEVTDAMLKIGAGFASPFLVGGWSAPEEPGAWTESESATMLFAPAIDTAPRLLRLDILPFLTIGVPLGIEVFLNNVSIGIKFICLGTTSIGLDNNLILVVHRNGDIVTLWLGPLILKSDGINIIEFRLTGIASPASLGHGTDLRKLGFQLSALQFVTLDQRSNI